MRALKWSKVLCVAAALLTLGPQGSLWAQRSSASPALGKEVARISIGAPIEKLIWSPDGRRVVALSRDFSLSSVNPDRGTRDWRVKALGLAPRATLAFVDGGAWILAAGTAPGTPPPMGAFHLWDARTGASQRWVDYDVPMETLQPRVLWAFSLSEDRATVASSGDGRSLLLHDTRTWTPLRRVGPIQGVASRPAAVIHASFDERRDRFVGARVLGEVFTWALSTARQVVSFKPFGGGGIGAMVLAPGTGHIVVAGDDQTPGDPQDLVAAYDPATARLLQVYRGPGFAVRSLAISNDGRLLAAIKTRSTTYGPGRALVWEAAGGRLLGSADIGESPDEGIAFSPDGQLLAYAADKTIVIVKLDTRMLR